MVVTRARRPPSPEESRAGSRSHKGVTSCRSPRCLELVSEWGESSGWAANCRGMERSSGLPVKRRVGRSEPLGWEVWMSCGGVPSRCLSIRRVGFALRAAAGLRPANVCRGSCMCSTPTRRGCRCPTGSSVCPAVRRARAAGGVEPPRLFEQAIGILHEQLPEGQRLDWSRVIVDASMVDAKKGARRSRAHCSAGPAAASTSPSTQTASRSRSGSPPATRTNAAT